MGPRVCAARRVSKLWVIAARHSGVVTMFQWSCGPWLPWHAPLASSEAKKYPSPNESNSGIALKPPNFSILHHW